MQMDVHQTPNYPFYHKENAQCYGNSHRYYASLTAILFSHNIKQRALGYQQSVSLHYLPMTGLPGPD